MNPRAILSTLGVLGLAILIWVSQPARAERVSMPSAAAVVAAPRQQTLSCRFGYAIVLNPISQISTTVLTALRGGVYSDYQASANPAQPLGIEHFQLVRIHQNKTGPYYDSPYVIPYTYTVWPSFSTIAVYAQSNPGALWLISNEPDRRDWRYSNGSTGSQDETVPELFAQAYHEISTVIKSADPTARVAAGGGLIEGTPLRIEYLNRMWNAYIAKYGAPMQPDAWHLHEFILPESSNPLDAGAGVPSGIDAPTGRWFDMLAQSSWIVSPTIFMQDIIAYRTWLASVGQRTKPLIISERGVMPDWINDDVSASYFLTTTFDFLLNYADPQIGNPIDGNRLVQSSIWFSLDDDRRDSEGYLYWGGHLINSTTQTLDPLGLTWYNYVQNNVPASQPDLVPVRIWQSQIPVVQPGSTATVTVVVDVSNIGNIGTGIPFSVTLKNSDNVEIGSQTLPALNGCALMQKQAIFSIPSLAPGAYQITVQVNPTGSVIESNYANNALAGTVIVASTQIFLPIILR